MKKQEQVPKRVKGLTVSKAKKIFNISNHFVRGSLFTVKDVHFRCKLPPSPTLPYKIIVLQWKDITSGRKMSLTTRAWFMFFVCFCFASRTSCRGWLWWRPFSSCWNAKHGSVRITERGTEPATEMRNKSTGMQKTTAGMRKPYYWNARPTSGYCWVEEQCIYNAELHHFTEIWNNLIL